MFIFRIMLLTVLLALCVTACPRLCAQDIPNPLPVDKISLQSLANGLRLVVREDHSLPLVAMVVVVHAGSAAESNTNGIAHYLEHLVFQGTAHYPGPLAPQHAIEQVGGVSNAVASRDMIRFQASVPSAQVEVLVKVLADVVQAPTLDEHCFARERPTILAEIQQKDDNPLNALFNHAYEFTYRTHPYRYTPTGTIEDVLGLSADQMQAFHQRWYVPNNMSVVMVGDITQARALQLVQSAFGAAKSAKLPVPPPVETEALSTPVRQHFSRDLAGTYQVMVFAAPPSSEYASLVATDVLTTLLAEGNDALLPAQWANDGLTVGQFGIEFVSTRAPGRILLWAQTDPRQAVKLRDATLNLLRALAAAPLPAETLALARQRVAGQFLLENETYTQQAATLAFYEGLGDVHLACRYIPTVQSVTAEQVQAAMPTKLLAWITIGQHPEGE